jgi:DNA-binding NarL/FixJ family response regulator
MMLRHLRVFLADDHSLIRAGIRAALASTPDMLLVGEAADGQGLVETCKLTAPHVIVLDLHMPGPPPFTLMAALRAGCPMARLLILTAYDDDVYVRGALTAGAAGYVLKDENTDTIVRAIRAVAQGGSWFSRPVAAYAVQRASGAAPAASPALTTREREVLRCVVDGKNNRETAALLGVSEKVVATSLRGLLAKLGVTTRLEAAVRATHEGLV